MPRSRLRRAGGSAAPTQAIGPTSLGKRPALGGPFALGRWPAIDSWHSACARASLATGISTVGCTRAGIGWLRPLRGKIGSPAPQDRQHWRQRECLHTDRLLTPKLARTSGPVSTSPRRSAIEPFQHERWLVWRTYWFSLAIPMQR